MKNLLMVIIVVALTSCDREEKPCIDQSKIDTGGGCTYEYAPVCGCDGKTYGNRCSAEKAGLTAWTTGSCEVK